MTRAGIYVRISSDPLGEGLGVERQREDCARLAEQRGWTVVETFTDNDVSAYSGAARPAYERMLAAIEAGAIGAVVAYRSDRLYRRMRDLERLVSIVEQHGIRIATVASGDIDLSTADGRMLARLVGSVAQAESERSGERLRRQRLQAAQSGIRPGGGRRPFGWTDQSMREQDEREAALLRQAIDALLSGASLGGIVTDWNERGIVTTTGRRWRVSTFRRMVLSEHLAGIRHHRPSGTRTRGTWTPIITKDEHAVLLARFPGMPDAPRQSRRRALLSGLVYCDVCGKRLMFSAGRYVCDKRRGGGCGQTRVNNGRALELEVLRQAEQIGESQRSERNDLDEERDALLAQLRALDERASALATMLGDGTLNPSEFTAARSQVQTQRADLERRLADGVAPNSDALESLNDALTNYLAGGALSPAEVAMLQDPLRNTVGRVFVQGRRGEFEVRFQK
jgi:DNA invertase Pin-like site-specific DNA recombinase